MNKTAFTVLLGFIAIFSALRAESFDAAAQTASIAGALKQYYGIDGTLELTSSRALETLPEQPTSVELLEVPPMPAANMLVKARFLKDGATLGEITTSFRAQWRVNVLVARRQVGKGSFDASNFETQTVDRLTLRQVPVDPNEDLKGFEVVSALSAGTALTWNHLKSQPLVRKGSLVDVIAEDGGLKITTRAVATQDAGRNEAVIMRNLTTNRQFEAYVVNENLVQIRF